MLNSNKGPHGLHLHLSPSPCQKCTCVSRTSLKGLLSLIKLKVEIQYILLLKKLLLALSVPGFFVLFCFLFFAISLVFFVCSGS